MDERCADRSRNVLRTAAGGVVMGVALAGTGCGGEDGPRLTGTFGSSTLSSATSAADSGDDDTTNGDTSTTEPGTTTELGTTTDVGTSTTDVGTSTLTGAVDSSSGSEGGPVCGDGILDAGEACDGDDVAGADCTDHGFPGGTLMCAKDCSIDTTACVSMLCGNGMLEGAEDCDGSTLGGATCATQGFSMGTLACSPTCTFDTDACSNPACGNGITEMGEICDGADLDGETCVDQGFAGGTLACLGNCAGYDTDGCDCAEEDIGGSMGSAVTTGNTSFDDDGLAPSCGGASGNDHVVRFTAPFAGQFAFDTWGSAFDTKLAVYGDCATELSCSDDAGGELQSLVTVDLLAGQSVLVVIDGFNGAAGNWVLNVFQPAVCGDGFVQFPEPCDGTDVGTGTCADLGFSAGTLLCDDLCVSFDGGGCFNGPACAEQDLGAATGVAVATGDTTTDDDGIAPSCGGANGNDHVMLFTAGVAGTYSFNTFGSGYDTKLALSSDCATELACNDDAGTVFQSRLSLAMAGGQQVLVTVDGFNANAGSWVLNVTPPFACEDQDGGSTLGSPALTGNTVAADNDLDPSCGLGNANDQVVRFTATATASYTFTTVGSAYDTVLSLWSDCATQLVCNDDTNGLQSQVQRNMVAGETVLVLVDGYNGATGNWNLNVTSP
ncbi:MAG: hypothetical protein IPK74_00960 [Deltaproteobacteria bacterium]|nr:hypothetical protein [Deltaproteobacteria bacterium]